MTGPLTGQWLWRKSYAAKDARIRVYQNETNLGDYPNRNQAASYAKGNTSSTWMPTTCMGASWSTSWLMRWKRFRKRDLACSITDPTSHFFPIVLQPAETYAAHYSGKHPVFGRSPINAIMKRDVFEEVGGFSGKRMVGDFEMWHILSARYPLHHHVCRTGILPRT